MEKRVRLIVICLLSIMLCAFTCTVWAVPEPVEVNDFSLTAAGMPAVETDGRYFYTASWKLEPTAGYTFQKYDMLGNFIEGFNIEGVSEVRDFTYDGTYFYASDNTNNIYCLNLAEKSLISTISLEQDEVIRGICYDASKDEFWISLNWGESLKRMDRDGAITFISEGTHGDLSVYGIVYEAADTENPHIWFFSQPDGKAAQYYVYDINTDALLQTEPVLDLQQSMHLADDDIAGGACSFYADGIYYIIGNIQSDPNRVAIYSLASAENMEQVSSFDTFVPVGLKGTKIDEIDVSAAGLTEGGYYKVMYEKISGPDWLTVTKDGKLNGTRPDEAQGSDKIVIKITDLKGNTCEVGRAVGEVLDANPVIAAQAGKGGTITPSGNTEVEANGSQVYVITPDQGYEILDVIVDDESVGAVEEYSFEGVVSDHTISAAFAEIPPETGDADTFALLMALVLAGGLAIALVVLRKNRAVK